MVDLVKFLEETSIPFAYDHFAEGESPDPPFICYLLPQSDHFSARREGLSEGQQCEISNCTQTVRIWLWNRSWKPCWIHTVFFMTKQRSGSRVKSSMKSSTRLKWRFDYYGKQGQV